MRFEHKTTLAQALAHWGAHEGQGRLHAQLKGRHLETPLDWVDLVMHTRAQMVAHILNRLPRLCIEVQLEPADASLLGLSSGRNVEEWLQGLREEQQVESLQHIEQLAHDGLPPNNRVLLVSPMLEEPATDTSLSLGPLTVYDGWHRVAAWKQRCESGQPGTLGAHLVVTTR